MFFIYIIVILIVTSIDFSLYGFNGYIDIKNANDSQLIFLIIQMSLFISPGFKGNEWYAKNLQKKGYNFNCSVEANNKEEAIFLATKSAI